MANNKEQGKTAQGIVIGGVGGTVLGALLTTLLAAKPAEAAPPEDKLNYLIECLTALVQVLAEVAESNTVLTGLLGQWLAAQGVPGVPGVPGVELTVKTEWVAKEPEVIFAGAITSADTFDANRMINWTRGKRLIIKVESSLDQAVQIQVVGNITDSYNLATDISTPLPCAAHSNISVGPAWDDWHPFIGVRITTAVAPTAGILKIDAVIQE